MHPMLEYGVELGTYTDAETGRRQYYAMNEAGDEYEVSRKIFCELYHADGTHAVKLSDKTVSRLRERGLLRTKRIVDDEVNKYIILFPMGERRSRKLRPLAIYCYRIHQALLIVLPALACLMSMLTTSGRTRLDFGLLVALLILSVVLHEFGHMIAALSFGAEIDTLGGLLVGGFLPLGAYVSYDYEILTTEEKVHALLAGIEVNFILACAFLSLRYFMPEIGFTLLCAVICNGLIILENLLPIMGTDGEHFLNLLFGVQDVAEYADKVAHSKKKLRNRFRQCGLIGRISLAILFGVRRRKALFAALLIASNAIWLLIV